MKMRESQILDEWEVLKNSFRGTKKPGTAVLIGAFVQNTETGGVWAHLFCAICHLAILSKVCYHIDNPEAVRGMYLDNL